MTKKTKKILGVLTFLPVIIGLFSFFSFFSLAVIADNGGEAGALVGFAGIFLLVFITGLATLGMMIYYVIHINQQNHADSNEKLLWTLVLIFAGGIGNMLYWYLKIWPEQDPKEYDEVFLEDELV